MVHEQRVSIEIMFRMRMTMQEARKTHAVFPSSSYEAGSLTALDFLRLLGFDLLLDLAARAQVEWCALCEVAAQRRWVGVVHLPSVVDGDEDVLTWDHVQEIEAAIRVRLVAGEASEGAGIVKPGWDKQHGGTDGRFAVDGGNAGDGSVSARGAQSQRCGAVLVQGERAAVEVRALCGEAGEIGVAATASKGNFILTGRNIERAVAWGGAWSLERLRVGRVGLAAACVVADGHGAVVVQLVAAPVRGVGKFDETGACIGVIVHEVHGDAGHG